MYLIVSLSICGLSLLLTVFVICVHHHFTHEGVPPWLRNTCRRIATLDCMRKVFDQVFSEPPARCRHEASSGAENQPKIEPQTNSKGNSRQEYLVLKISDDVKLPNDVIKVLEGYMRKENEKERESQNKAEWEMVAKLVDQFLFVCYVKPQTAPP